MCTCEVDTSGFEGTAICCPYASVAEHDIETLYLRRELSKVLPPYMLPTRWRAFDTPPKNINGKIDWRLIREHFEADRPAALTVDSTSGA